MVHFTEVALIKQTRLDRAVAKQLSDRGGPQSCDPAQALHRTQVLTNAGLGNHPSVADQHDFIDLETLADLGDLRRQRGRVSSVAFEDLDSYGTPIDVGQEAEHDLKFVLAPVARVTQLGERA